MNRRNFFKSLPFLAAACLIPKKEFNHILHKNNWVDKFLPDDPVHYKPVSPKQRYYIVDWPTRIR